jgi:8-oxo-dGTP pyrophosphatase MutT (NUDIX family)
MQHPIDFTRIEQLRTEYHRGLPGETAQFRMANPRRVPLKDAPTDARMACVLALLYPRNGVWHFALIERTSHNPNDRHKGQMSFPGGQLDSTDASLEACALREAHEEIGIHTADVELIGALSELYIPVSGYRVVPFLGFTRSTPHFVLQKNEVAQLIEAPISRLLDDDVIQFRDIWISEKITLPDVPYYAIEGKMVWGATAMILGELMELLLRIELDTPNPTT